MFKPNFGLVVVYRNKGKILPIASVSDSGMIQRAARRAVSEARNRAKEARGIDPALGALHLAEAHKLSEILDPLIGTT